MPRKKRLPNDSLTEDPASQEVYLSTADADSRDRRSLVPATDTQVSNQSNKRLTLREDFENDSAEDLVAVRDTLREILTSGKDKERLVAAKLILQVNGLLEKKQTVDADSISNLVSALLQRTSVSIKDVVEGEVVENG